MDEAAEQRVNGALDRKFERAEEKVMKGKYPPHTEEALWPQVNDALEKDKVRDTRKAMKFIARRALVTGQATTPKDAIRFGKANVHQQEVKVRRIQRKRYVAQMRELFGPKKSVPAKI